MASLRRAAVRWTQRSTDGCLGFDARHAGVVELLCHVAQLDVQSLGGVAQPIERLGSGDSLTFPQDSLRLSDDLSGGERLMEVLTRSRSAVRSRIARSDRPECIAKIRPYARSRSPNASGSGDLLGSLNESETAVLTVLTVGDCTFTEAASLLAQPDYECAA